MVRDDGEWWLRGAPVPMTEKEPATKLDRLISLTVSFTSVVVADTWGDRYGPGGAVLRAFAAGLVVLALASAVAHASGHGAGLRSGAYRGQRTAAVLAPLLGGGLYLLGAFVLRHGAASMALRAAGCVVAGTWMAVEIVVDLGKRRADRHARRLERRRAEAR